MQRQTRRTWLELSHRADFSRTLSQRRRWFSDLNHKKIIIIENMVNFIGAIKIINDYKHLIIRYIIVFHNK